jgi:hypothetical protein
VSWDEYHALSSASRSSCTSRASRSTRSSASRAAGCASATCCRASTSQPLAILSTHSYTAEGGTVRGELVIAEHMTMTKPRLGAACCSSTTWSTRATRSSRSQRAAARFPHIVELRTAVLWWKACSVFKPDYCVEYLPDNPWIHQPFEDYDDPSATDARAHALSARARMPLRHLASLVADRGDCYAGLQGPPAIPSRLARAAFRPQHNNGGGDASPQLRRSSRGPRFDAAFGDSGYFHGVTPKPVRRLISFSVEPDPSTRSRSGRQRPRLVPGAVHARHHRPRQRTPLEWANLTFLNITPNHGYTTFACNGQGEQVRPRAPVAASSEAQDALGHRAAVGTRDRPFSPRPSRFQAEPAGGDAIGLVVRVGARLHRADHATNDTACGSCPTTSRLGSRRELRREGVDDNAANACFAMTRRATSSRGRSRPQIASKYDPATAAGDSTKRRHAGDSEGERAESGEDPPRRPQGQVEFE